MTEQKSAGGLDFETLRRAREQRDADLLLSLYADDAEVRVVDRSTPRAHRRYCAAKRPPSTGGTSVPVR